MPIPPLPDEIIGWIIGFNLQTFSGESEYELRQDRLYSLLGPQGYGMVASVWQSIARREAFRYLDLNISEEKGAARLRKLKEKSMSGTKYAELVQKLWTTQDDTPGSDQSLVSMQVHIYGPRVEEKAAASDRVKTVLKTCTRLREVCMDYVDAESLRLLSQLPELHSLHLDGPIGLLGNSTHQFQSLRHLTMNSTKIFSLCPRDFDVFGAEKHNFFLPHHLPSLESLSLSNIPLNFPEFFKSFLKCAPRLKSLFLSNLKLFELNAKTGFWRPFSSEETVEVLCTEVVPACRALKNLGLFFRAGSRTYFKYSSSFPPSTETVYFGFCGSMNLLFDEDSRDDIVVNGWSKIFLTRFKRGEDNDSSKLDGVLSWARDKGVELEEINYWDHYMTGPNRSLSLDEVFELRIWNAIHLS